MSKRGADEYITKEHGSTPNKQEDSRPKMATAAQKAKRKIAEPKSRLNRSNAGSPAPSSNPFGGSAFGSSQPSQQIFGNIGGGPIFGQSQSFPPSNLSAPSDFTFSVPSQSTSFTFGQPVQNNPFASPNGGMVQDENKPPEDTVMESPQKKPTFGAGAFGSTQNTNTNGGLFAGFTGFTQSNQTQSQAASQQSLGNVQPQVNGFGSSSSTPLFGKPQSQSVNRPAESTTQSSGLFSQSASTRPNTTDAQASSGPFGQPSTQQQTPSLTFGQPPSEASKSPFKFSQSAPQPLFASTPQTPSFKLGQPSSSEPKADAPKYMFGQTAGQQSSTITSTSASSSAPTTTTTAAAFGQSTGTPAQSIFGGLGTPKPQETPAKSVSEANAAPSTVDQSLSNTTALPNTTQVSNPFSGLFTQTSKQVSSASTSETQKPVFNFSAPAQSTSLFSTTPSSQKQPTSLSATDTAANPLFGFKPADPSKAPTSIFSPSKTGANTPVAAPLSGNSNTNEHSSSGQQDKKSTANDTPTSAFGQSSTSKPTASATPASSTGYRFGTPTSAIAQSSTTTPSTSLKRPAPNPLQETIESTPVAKQPKARDENLPEQTTAATTENSVTEQQNKTPTAANDPQRAVYTNPPARIPPYLSAEKYKSYDSNYRLHSLNREFQRRIACLDPTREDFENIVRTYVAARESIGESIGLYLRNIAGTKRKEDRMDDSNGDTNTAKKAKTASTPLTQSTPSRAQFDGSIFQPVTSTSQNSLSSAKPATPGSSNTSSLFKSMIPENAASQSSTTSGVSQSPFTQQDISTPSKSSTGIKFGTVPGQAGLSANSTAAKTTTPPSSPPKRQGFKPSGFSAPSASDFMNAFKKQSEVNNAKFEKEKMEKRKAEDFDSEEDDEEEWTKKYEEEQRAKRAKIGAFRGFTPSFENSDASDDNASSKKIGQKSKSPANISSDEGATEDDNGEEANEEVSGEDAADEEAEEDGDDEDDGSVDDQPLITNGKSIFDRISRGSDSKQDSTPKPDLGNAAMDAFAKNHKATPETPSFSPITPSSNNAFKAATTFTFTPTPRDSPTPTAGTSVFDGGFTKDGPIPGEGLFGSRSSTPVNGETTSTKSFGNLSASQNTPGEDHTWKKGSAIKFGSESQMPAVNITAPSPLKETPKFGTLFGAGTTAAGGTSSSNSLGFQFSASTSIPAPGFLSAASHLAPGSGTTSGISSRATSPGATDNESVATNETDDAQSDPQSSLLAHSGPYPGEENEDILFEARTKLFRHYKEEIKGTKKTKGWNVEGLGPMRILKNKDTGKCRIVVRADPNANIVLNANLTSGVSYKANGSNVVIPVFTSGSPIQWMVKVKTPTIAAELASVLENNKVH